MLMLLGATYLAGCERAPTEPLLRPPPAGPEFVRLAASTVAQVSAGSAHSCALRTVDGTGVTQVTSARLAGNQLGHLAWLPDGRRIAFEGLENSTSKIFVVKVDQPGEVEQLTTKADGGVDVNPAWTWARN